MRCLAISFICLLALCLPVGACAGPVLKDHAIVPLTITQQDGKTVSLSVELAISAPAQERGLMFRTALPENSGMLFLFRYEDPRAFWMRNTLIPLDMVFIRKGGKILNIHANAIPHDETPILSGGPAIAVLELKGGRARQLGLKPGDIVHLPVLPLAPQSIKH